LFFRAKHFSEFGIFGVVDSNIFTRIFGHSPVLFWYRSWFGLVFVLILRILDLRVLSWVFLNIPRRFNEDTKKIQDDV
jgi:hypothetical protein